MRNNHPDTLEAYFQAARNVRTQRRWSDEERERIWEEAKARAGVANLADLANAPNSGGNTPGRETAGQPSSTTFVAGAAPKIAAVVCVLAAVGMMSGRQRPDPLAPFPPSPEPPRERIVRMFQTSAAPAPFDEPLSERATTENRIPESAPPSTAPRRRARSQTVTPREDRAEALYEQARQAQNEGDYDTVAERCERLMAEFQSHPRASDAALMLANLRKNQGRHREAADAYHRASMLARSESVAREAILAEVRLRWHIGERAEATRLARQYASQYPDDRHGIDELRRQAVLP